MYLLDVNLLISLCDEDHVHHRRAKSWFRKSQANGWATCPLTENALLRIMGHPDYPRGPGTPAAVVPILQQLRAHPNHTFIADSISLAEADRIPSLESATPKMLTDLYLLALAVSQGCQLATLDQRIQPNLVIGAPKSLCVIPV